MNQFNHSRQTVRSDNVDKLWKSIMWNTFRWRRKLTSCGVRGPKGSSLTNGNPGNDFASTPIQIKEHSKIVLSRDRLLQELRAEIRQLRVRHR